MSALELPERLVELFRLTPSEQGVVNHLLTATAALSVAALAEALDIKLAEAIRMFGLEGTLRGRGLIEVEDKASLGWLLPTDLIFLGRGLHLLASSAGPDVGDDSMLLTGQIPGASYLPTPSPEHAWANDLAKDKPPASITDLVREHLAASHGVLLWLGGVGPGELPPLLQAVRTRLQRPVVHLDGAALAGWPIEQLYPALRRLRRDTDLRGAVVLVSEVRSLGAAWRALCQPRPIGQTAPVILCSSDALSPLGRPPQGAPGEAALMPVTATLLRPAAGPGAGHASSAASAAASDAAAAEDPALLASREAARRRAAVDAAAAMGRPIPPELLDSMRAPAPAAPQRAAAPAERSPDALARTPPPAPAPTAPRAQERAAPAAAPNPRLAAALAKAGLPPVGSTEYQRPSYSARPAPIPAMQPETPPRAASERPLPPAAAAPAAPLPPPETDDVPSAEGPNPAAVPQGAPAVSLSEEEQPPLPLEADAPLTEIIRVARATQNTAQRIELMRSLAGTRSPAVIQLFRTHLSAQHPDVRAAAEAGMMSLFGQNWNRSRPIAPPIQPPRSDDGGRGPGGAF